MQFTIGSKFRRGGIIRVVFHKKEAVEKCKKYSGERFGGLRCEGARGHPRFDEDLILSCWWKIGWTVDEGVDG